MEMERRQGELKEAQDTIRRLEDQLRETQVEIDRYRETSRRYRIL